VKPVLPLLFGRKKKQKRPAVPATPKRERRSGAQNKLAPIRSLWPALFCGSKGVLCHTAWDRSNPILHFTSAPSPFFYGVSAKAGDTIRCSGPTRAVVGVLFIVFHGGGKVQASTYSTPAGVGLLFLWMPPISSGARGVSSLRDDPPSTLCKPEGLVIYLDG